MPTARCKSDMLGRVPREPEMRAAQTQSLLGAIARLPPRERDDIRGVGRLRREEGAEDEVVSIVGHG